MKHWMMVCALLSSTVALNAQQNPDEAAVQQTFGSGGTVRLHLEAGGYKITPSDANTIRVSYPTHSEGRSNKVRVQIKLSALRADVYVSNTPHDNFRATIEVPRHSNLWARLSAGEMDIGEVEGDKNVELWAGQLNIAAPHPEAYGHRDASVIAGSLEASAFNISKGGLFRSFSEEGPGKYRLHAQVTTGEIDVR
jgi:hypothetical protein